MFSRDKVSTVDLIDQKSDWGLTVSEAAGKRSLGSKLFLAGALALVMVASLIVLPVLAGVFIFNASSGVLKDVAVVLLVCAIAFAFKFQSGRNPRNAIQIDYKASEIRLGFQSPKGQFVREKVVGFRQVQDVSVDHSDPDTPKLVIELAGSTVNLGFNKAEEESVADLSRQIMAARETAMRAPIRSRVQSKIAGVGASIRERTRRVSSRVAY